MITPEQVKAARKLLAWSQLQLEFEASVGDGTVGHFEAHSREISKSKLNAIQRALEGAGIVFVKGNGTRVRLRER